MCAAAAQIEIHYGNTRDGYYEGQVRGCVSWGVGTYVGVVIYGGGTRYEGEFRDYEYHGHGTLTHWDGTVESGQWDEDRFLTLLQTWGPGGPGSKSW